MTKKNTKPKKRKQAPAQKQGGAELFFFALIVVLIGGGIFFAVHNPELRTELAKILAPHHPAKDTKKIATANSNGSSPVHFDFYAELRNRQVTAENKSNNKARVEKHKTTAATTKATTFNKPARSTYILTLATFRQKSNAIQLRVSLLLSGVEVNIVKVKTSDHDVYRVQQGPFSNLQVAKAQQQQLQKKGVERAVIEKIG